jgi:hypothetical protein
LEHHHRIAVAVTVAISGRITITVARIAIAIAGVTVSGVTIAGVSVSGITIAVGIARALVASLGFDTRVDGTERGRTAVSTRIGVAATDE